MQSFVNWKTARYMAVGCTHKTQTKLTELKIRPIATKISIKTTKPKQIKQSLTTFKSAKRQK